MQIKTTGQLRSFLADTMVKVAEGKISIEKASQIHKTAGQITESFYAEVKAQALAIALGRVADAPKMGDAWIDSSGTALKAGDDAVT